MGRGCCGVWSVELVVLRWFSSQRAAITHRRDMKLSMMMHLLPPAQCKHYACCTPLYHLQYIFVISFTCQESRALTHMSYIFTYIYLLVGQQWLIQDRTRPHSLLFHVAASKSTPSSSSCRLPLYLRNIP